MIILLKNKNRQLSFCQLRLHVVESCLSVGGSLKNFVEFRVPFVYIRQMVEHHLEAFL